MRPGFTLPLTRMLKSANPANHVLFSGCRDNQTSADVYISGAYNGAFTYYFCRHIRDVQGAIRQRGISHRVLDIPAPAVHNMAVALRGSII
ncbi:MAG: caspase family protein [Desulfatirhabdiaceae bacterium]|nr:caspase family protein [Desulfatirhabdiaceae bacterium]